MSMLQVSEKIRVSNRGTRGTNIGKQYSAKAEKVGMDALLLSLVPLSPIDL
jgi:hypothetical protein